MADLQKLYEELHAAEPGSLESDQAADAILEKIFDVQPEYPMNGLCC